MSTGSSAAEHPSTQQQRLEMTEVEVTTTVTRAYWAVARSLNGRDLAEDAVVGRGMNNPAMETSGRMRAASRIRLRTPAERRS